MEKPQTSEPGDESPEELRDQIFRLEDKVAHLEAENESLVNESIDDAGELSETKKERNYLGRLACAVVSADDSASLKQAIQDLADYLHDELPGS